MLLKRHYREDKKTLSYLEIKHTGTHAAQHFSIKLVAQGLAEGWITLSGTTLTLHAKPEALVYAVVRVPGKYPNPQAPSGTEVIHYYDCRLTAQQQARFGVQKGKR